MAQNTNGDDDPVVCLVSTRAVSVLAIEFWVNGDSSLKSQENVDTHMWGTRHNILPILYTTQALLATQAFIIH